MHIIAPSQPLENCKNDQVYRVEAAENEKELLEAGYRRSERSYIVKENYKEYTVICPEYRSAAKDANLILIIPEFLLPGRPYPVYVYLYAISLYSAAPNKGQRRAAEETRKHFKLHSFAHTTLGRALKTFVRSADAVVVTAAQTETEELAGSKAAKFPTVQWTASARSRIAPFLRDVPLHSGIRQTVSAILELVRQWFKEYRRLLL